MLSLSWLTLGCMKDLLSLPLSLPKSEYSAPVKKLKNFNYTYRDLCILLTLEIHNYYSTYMYLAEIPPLSPLPSSNNNSKLSFYGYNNIPAKSVEKHLAKKNNVIPFPLSK